MVAARPLPSPLEIALANIEEGVGLTKAEAALVRASMTPEAIAEAEASFGCRVEDLWIDSPVTWEQERAFLLGEGPDPWPASS
jgi:hypothetical protein